MSSLTAEIDVSDGLAHVGLEEYAPLFVQHEIGRPMLELLNEERSIWPELFASDLSSVRPEHRDRMVEATPTILEFCAARCKEEDDLATKYLGLTPRSKRKMEAERAWAEAAPRPPPRAAAPKEPSLPGARPEDGCIGLWLEKKSPSVVKGWQRRWFVLNPQGELQYYTDPSKENLGAKGKQKQNQALFLKNCTKITSNNMDSGHFELHFPNKMIELRVEDVHQIQCFTNDSLQYHGLALFVLHGADTGSGACLPAAYWCTQKTRSTLAIIEQIFQGLHSLGSLAPANDGKIHKQTALEQLGVTSAAPAKDQIKIPGAGNLNI